MSVVVATGLVVPTTTGQVTRTYGEIKEDVCVAVDGETDPVQLVKAGRAINRVIQKLNLMKSFRFNRVQASDVNLVAAQAGYAVDTNVLMVDEVQLINSDGDVARTLDFYPWHEVNEKVETQSDEGVPLWWTLYNRARQGEILLYATPDANAAADYDLRIHNRLEISRLASDSDQLIGPPQLGEVLTTGGEFLILYWRERKNPASWGSAERRFEEACHDLSRLDANMDGDITARRIAFEE